MAKANPVITELRKINKKLDIVEESVNLGTFDATMLALMIFIFATAVSLVSLNAFNFLKTVPPLLVSFVYFLLFAVFIVFILQWWIQSIFVKDMRFTIKTICMTVLSGMGIFFGLLISLMFFLWWWEVKNGAVTGRCVELAVLVILIASVLYAIFYQYPQSKKYLEQNFKNIIKRRLQEIKKSPPKRALINSRRK